MLGPEFLCNATVSTESSFNHVSGPLGGQNQKEKFGGNLPSGGDLVIHAERIMGNRVREVEGKIVSWDQSSSSGPL